MVVIQRIGEKEIDVLNEKRDVAYGTYIKRDDIQKMEENIFGRGFKMREWCIHIK